MADALSLRKSSRSPLARKVFLAVAGVLSIALAGGAVFSIYTIRAAERAFQKLPTDERHCRQGGLCGIHHTAGECTKKPCNFLILGSDSRAGLSKAQQAEFGNTSIVQGQRADTIIVVTIDPVRNRTIVLSIPRDLRVEVSGHGLNKINSAFRYGNGAQVMLQTVEKLTGFQINHYVEVNFTGFERLVTALGGIHMCIDRPMIDKLAGLHLPSAGCYDLKGAQALAFVRARHIEGDAIPDFSRISRQQQFMRVVIQKLLSFGVVLHFRQLIDAVSDNLVVDDGLNLYDLQDLTRKLSGLGQRGVFFRVVPAVPVQIDGVDYVQMRPEAEELFEEIRDGKRLSNVGREAPSTAISPANVTVRVYDASGNGDAQKVVTYLGDAGFVVLPLGPAPSGLVKTEILYRRNLTDEERVVSSYLPEIAAFVDYRHVKASRADVVVVIGPDFQGIPL